MRNARLVSSAMLAGRRWCKRDDGRRIFPKVLSLMLSHLELRRGHFAIERASAYDCSGKRTMHCTALNALKAIKEILREC